MQWIATVLRKHVNSALTVAHDIALGGNYYTFGQVGCRFLFIVVFLKLHEVSGFSGCHRTMGSCICWGMVQHFEYGVLRSSCNFPFLAFHSF